MTIVNPRTALVSWAHRNPGWSDAEAERWIASTVRFAALLHKSGIDAELDLYHEGDTSIDWTRWGQQQVRERDLVVIVISGAWKERWEGTNSPRQGAGAVAEADALKGRFNTNQAEFQRRTILVLLPGVSDDNIPFDLHRLHRVRVTSLDNEGIAGVVRLFSGKSRYVKPEVRTPSTPSLEVISRWRGSADSLQKQQEQKREDPAVDSEKRQAYLFAVAHTKSTTDPLTGEHAFDLEPGQWHLALEEREEGFLVNSKAGRLGILRDISQIERG